MIPVHKLTFNNTTVSQTALLSKKNSKISGLSRPSRICLTFRKPILGSYSQKHLDIYKNLWVYWKHVIL